MTSRTAGRPTMENLQTEQIQPTFTPEETDKVQIFRGSQTGKATLAAVGGVIGGAGSTGPTGPTGSTGATGGTGPTGSVSLGTSRWVGPVKIGCFDGQYVVLTSGGDIASGSFTLTLGDETSDPITFPPTQSGVREALEAMPSIGPGNVSVTIDDNTDFAVVFHNALAGEVMTGDGAGLVGPSSPYSISVSITNPLRELLTPDVGDIVEDFMRVIKTTFDVSTKLYFTDYAANPPGSAPQWSNPISAQGVDGFDLTYTNDYTNFYSVSASGADARATAQQAMMAAPVEDGSTSVYGNLPAVVKNSVPIYAFVEYDDTPSEGEVWIYAKIATPATA